MISEYILNKLLDHVFEIAKLILKDPKSILESIKPDFHENLSYHCLQ